MVVCMWLDTSRDLHAWLRRGRSRSLGARGDQCQATKACSLCVALCEKVHPPSLLAGEVKEDYFTAVSPQLCAGIGVARLDKRHVLRSCPPERHSCTFTT